MSFEGIEAGKAFREEIGRVITMCAEEVFRICEEKKIKPDRLTIIANINAMTMQFVSHVMLTTLLAQSEASKEADEMMKKFEKFSKVAASEISEKEKEDMGRP